MENCMAIGTGYVTGRQVGTQTYLQVMENGMVIGAGYMPSRQVHTHKQI